MNFFVQIHSCNDSVHDVRGLVSLLLRAAATIRRRQRVLPRAVPPSDWRSIPAGKGEPEGTYKIYPSDPTARSTVTLDAEVFDLAKIALGRVPSHPGAPDDPDSSASARRRTDAALEVCRALLDRRFFG